MAQFVAEKSYSSKPLYNLYEAAKALRSCGINCCIWCEDLLWHLNARTVAVDHFFLVADPEAASLRLEHLGFHRLDLNPRYRFMSELLKDSVRLARPSDMARNDKESKELPATVLLSATMWSFPIDQLNQMRDILPPVSLVASSFIDTWLDAETMNFRLLLRSYIGYVVEYIKQTGDDDFEGQLKYEYQRDIWRSYKMGTLFGSERTEWLKRRQAERDLQQSDIQKPNNH